MIKDKFEFLTKEWNMSEPLININRCNMTLSYIGKKIAFELEVDSRDIGFTVLITKVVNSNLPGGYYIFNGEIVRIFLFKVFKGQDQPQSVSDIRKIVKNRKKGKDKEYLHLLIDKYKELMYSVGKNLITMSEKMFFGGVDFE